MAFHLGCLRALHDRGLLAKVKVLSTVSGGSVIGACYAYSSDDFIAFDRRLTELLRCGIQRLVIKEILAPTQLAKIVCTALFSGLPALAAWTTARVLSTLRIFTGIPSEVIERKLIAWRQTLPVWGSFSTSFEKALEKIFQGKNVQQVGRKGLNVVINACDLKTGTAFRFGSKRSGGWRYGEIVGEPPTVAKAVAASAAYPVILPPLVENFDFARRGKVASHQVLLTDGGIFDNSGVAVL